MLGSTGSCIVLEACLVGHLGCCKEECEGGGGGLMGGI